MSEVLEQVIDPTEAQYHQGYQLRLQFSDGTECFVDILSPFSEGPNILRFKAISI